MIASALLATAHNLVATLTVLEDPFEASPAEIICALLLAIGGLLYLLVRSNEGLKRREDARRKLFEPNGSNDLRRAMRYRGVSPHLLGQENVALYSGSTRDRRRS